MRRLIAASATAVTLLTGLGVAGSAAAAPAPRVADLSAAPQAVVTSHGFTIQTPDRLVAYNNHPLAVRATVRKLPATQANLLGSWVVAYSGGRRVASGSVLQLRPGSYYLSGNVRYRPYRYVTRYRTVYVKKQVFVPGATPSSGTTCVIQAVWLDDAHQQSSTTVGTTGVAIGSAGCTNPAFPQQTVSVSGDTLTDVSGTSFTVGQSVTTAKATFRGYFKTVTVAQKQPYQFKQVLAPTTFAAPRRSLIVRDGGYVRIYSGSDDGNIFFTAHAAWQWAYIIDCSDFGYLGVDMHYAGYTHVGSFGPGDAPYGESSNAGGYPWAGKVELDVFDANCDLTIGIFSRAPIGNGW